MAYNSLLDQKQNQINSVLQNISLINQGAGQQVGDIMTGAYYESQGSLMAAGALRQSSSLVGKATAFNLDVESNNLVRQLDSLSRNYQLTVGQQLSAQSASGFSTSSKSFQTVQGEALQNSTTSIIQAKIDAENARRAEIFNTTIQQTNLENQAKAYEYQAQVTQILAGRRANQIMQNANQQTSLLRNQLSKTTGSLFS